MIRRPPRSTRTDTLFPYTTLFRSLHARNPAHDLPVGGRNIAFGSVASAPSASDLDGGRRPGNQRDYQNFLRLSQAFNVVHFLAGYPVEPTDLHPATRHLDCLRESGRAACGESVSVRVDRGGRRIIKKNRKR